MSNYVTTINAIKPIPEVIKIQIFNPIDFDN